MTPSRDDREPAILEIVEANPSWEPGPGAAGLVKPNAVVLNGQRLFVPEGDPIVVHEVRLNDPRMPADDCLKVTLTLWCRRVFMGNESESPERAPEAGDA